VPELIYGRIDGPLGLDSLIHTTTVDDRRTRGRSVGASVLALERHRPPDGERGSAVLSSELPLQCRAQLGLWPLASGFKNPIRGDQPRAETQQPGSGQSDRGDVPKPESIGC
jgi:hypothetical protein